MITLFRCVEISVAEISNTSRISFLNILMLEISTLRFELHQFVDEPFLEHSEVAHVKYLIMLPLSFKGGRWVRIVCLQTSVVFVPPNPPFF